MNIKSLNEKLIRLEEELLDEKKKSKKKKPYDSVTYTTGDIQKNIDHFNKMLGGKAENNHTDGYLNGTFKGPEAASPDGASCVSGDSGSAGGEGGGMGESLALNEDSFYASKIGVEVELPNNVHILDKEQIEAFLPHLEPEEEFTIGYITPLYFYQELWSKFTLLKCTELVGYTGIDYIEARSDNANKEQRIAAAKQTAELGNDNGIHLDRQPDARQVGDFSADYELTNKTVKQHRDNSKNTPEVIAKNLSTILFYPKVGSQPKVVYYIDLHNGMGYLKVSREQIEPTILKRVAEIANELDSGKNKDGSPRKRRWDDAQLAAKIRKQLETDAATITAVPLSAEDKFETRSRFFDGSSNVSKPQVRALYTNQIYLLETKDAKVGKSLIESLTEAKRYVRRYYMKPQNIFCSNKDEVLKALIDHEDEDCIIYTLINLGDIKDISKLNSNDIIYFYEDGILYDKNHVRIMDYELSIKHEEERAKINPEQVSDAKFADVYQDRMTGVSDLSEAFNLDFDNINAYGNKLTESQSQEIENSYKQLSKMYNVDLEELVYGEDGFMKSCYPNGFEDFAGDIIYSEKYWNEFEKWLKEVKGIELKNIENELNLEFNDVNAFGESLKEGKEFDKCCICGEEIDGYGNNPEPYKHEGRCCDACNLKFVIPARLEQINISEEED